MLNHIIASIREFRNLGATLRIELPHQIEKGIETGWTQDSLKRIREDAGKYFALVSRVSRWLGLCVIIPLVPVALWMMWGGPIAVLNVLWTGWFILVAAVSVWFLSPGVALAFRLGRIPKETLDELTHGFWLHVDVVNIALSIVLFCYALAGWEFLRTGPLALIAIVLWLFAPWAILKVRQHALFVAIRVVQFVLLVAAAAFALISPVPMSHFQWAAQRSLAETIRPNVQQERTQDWRTIQWFTQEGIPNVWYSFSPERGYRLFAAPGHDPDTNQDLLPVADKTTKDRIVNSFVTVQTAEAARIEVDNRKKEEDVREQELQKEQAAASAAADQERKAAADLEQRYVVSTASAPQPVVLVALDEGNRFRADLTSKLSETMTKAGFSNSINVFTPEFIASPDFDALLSGAAPNHLFQASRFARRLLIVTTKDSISSEEPLNGVSMLADDSIWMVRLISARDGAKLFAREIKVRGIGFNESNASTNADERAEVELTKLVSELKQGM
jgi:hypothetical protein